MMKWDDCYKISSNRVRWWSGRGDTQYGTAITEHGIVFMILYQSAQFTQHSLFMQFVHEGREYIRRVKAPEITKHSAAIRAGKFAREIVNP